jgi:hypothetical protein
MPTCEKCWSDAHGDPYVGVPERYRELLAERHANPCTPEEQAGPAATECPMCHRRTCHQHCGVCMACGYDPARQRPEESDG